MHPKDILLLTLTIALATCSEPPSRTLNRLAGGHLKTRDQTPNDAELLDALPTGDKKKQDADGSAPGGDEEKKTLAQQVADGKYGLIQKELFRKPLKRPGILSYDANPEVPKDNVNSLGGLSKEDIWLAENHLLVIKGGTYPKHSDKFDDNPLIWPAIDNYTAPKRPVKIPAHPKVPPPFPVQLHDDGPLQILGGNDTRPPHGHPLPPEGGYVPGTGPFFPPRRPDPTDPPAGRAPHPRPPHPSGEDARARPFPPSNGSFAPSINDFDEDDPSIYYPPPYSFSYPSKEESSAVPAGPLVPGIILPPPPDFFAPAEEATTTRKTPKRPAYTKRPKKTQKTTQQSPQIHPTTTPVPPTSVISITLRKPIKVTQDTPKHINNELTTTPKTPPKTKRPSVTILKPVPVQHHRTFYNQSPSPGDPFLSYRPPKTTPKPETTQVPSNNYYPERTTAQPNYYYYQEEPQNEKVVHNFFNLPNQYFEAPRRAPQARTKYVYVTSKPRYNLVRPRGRPASFNVHLDKLREQIEYFSSPRPAFREIQQPRAVYQYSFQASNYKGAHQGDFRPSQPDAPSDDDQGFKPIPRYSVQIQQSLDLSTHQPPPQNPVYFKETFRATTQRPTDQHQQPYYTTSKPSYAYTVRNNQGYDGYFHTSQDAYYEDQNKPGDFGQRLPTRTTPRPSGRYSTRSPKVVYVTGSSNKQRQPRPVSLEGDTLVNYVNPHPNLNPDAELIPVEPQQRPKYQNYSPRPQIPYNFNPRQTFSNRPQFVEAIPISVPDEDSRKGSFISYSLPGNDGAHFYFLTPQLAQSRDQGADFYYSRRENERIRREDREGKNG